MPVAFLCFRCCAAGGPLGFEALLQVCGEQLVEQLGQVGADDIVVAAVVPRTSWPCSSSTKPTVIERASFAQANACSAATTKLITSRIAELDCSAFASAPSTYSREAFVPASAKVLCASCRSVGCRSSAGLGN